MRRTTASTCHRRSSPGLGESDYCPGNTAPRLQHGNLARRLSSRESSDTAGWNISETNTTRCNKLVTTFYSRIISGGLRSQQRHTGDAAEGKSSGISSRHLSVAPLYGPARTCTATSHTGSCVNRE